MKTVYGLGQGEYSDFRIIGLFESREDAERVMESRKLGGGWSELFVVVEMPLYAAGEIKALPVADDLAWFARTFVIDGQIREPWYVEETDPYELSEHLDLDGTPINDTDGKGGEEVVAFGRSEEHARRVLKERAAVVAARQAGIG